ncbi:MAG: L,D-transpeptidase family protein [Planctomycetes bacterium]|nr:L,D-transpeptidase family protein [Planctomycetota bacterium]
MRCWPADFSCWELESISSRRGPERPLSSRWLRWTSRLPYPWNPFAFHISSSTSRNASYLLYDGGTLVRRYPVGLGPSPEGDKTREGDGTTPIGTYVVCTRNERSRFHLFLGLSYPGPKDADRGLREGRIARRQHEAIGTAFVQGRQPPWDTPLGGAIGIHGGGAGRDWTLGCIALANEDVEELWAVAALGTPVVIEP